LDFLPVDDLPIDFTRDLALGSFFLVSLDLDFVLVSLDLDFVFYDFVSLAFSLAAGFFFGSSTLAAGFLFGSLTKDAGFFFGSSTNFFFSFVISTIPADYASPYWKISVITGECVLLRIFLGNSTNFASFASSYYGDGVLISSYSFFISSSKGSITIG
jgi:hypothetical protein